MLNISMYTHYHLLCLFSYHILKIKMCYQRGYTIDDRDITVNGWSLYITVGTSRNTAYKYMIVNTN